LQKETSSETAKKPRRNSKGKFISAEEIPTPPPKEVKPAKQDDLKI